MGVAYFKHKVLLGYRIPCLSADSHTGFTLFVSISSLCRCPQSLALSRSKMQWHRSLCPKDSGQEGKGRERVCAEDAVSEEVRTEIKLLSLQVG